MSKPKLYLKPMGQPAVALEKPYFTVGYDASNDLCLTLNPLKRSGAIFVIHAHDSGTRVVPSDEKVRLNGKILTGPAIVSPCDRIEAAGSVLSLIDGPIAATAAAEKVQAFDLLPDLEEFLSETSLASEGLEALLKAVAVRAGAETVHLLTEEQQGEPGTGWKFQASYLTREESLGRTQVVSNTIVNEAIKQNAVVCIESVVGHPLNASASLLGARLFSLAVVPLTLSGTPFGILYLSSETPGTALKKEELEGLRSQITMAALLLLSRKTEKATRRKEVPKAQTLRYESESMRAVVERLNKLAGSDLSVLIRGETGTGKELLAREIHQASKRSKGPFIVVNCAAIPTTLLESVLFGHKKGAFTGATSDRIGKFAQAGGGTIFLDEVAELPLEIQAKLLRVLQEREVEPLGEEKPVRVDFRVVAASHRDLEAMVKEKTFREDLFFRLNGAALVVPPLRDRGPQEILLLVQHVLDKNSYPCVVSPEARAKLLQHRWPGNIRELEQSIIRAAVLATGSSIEADDIELAGASTPVESTAWMDNDGSDVREEKRRFLHRRVEAVLGRTGGNRAEAAKLLGISERTLYRILATQTVSH